MSISPSKVETEKAIKREKLVLVGFGFLVVVILGVMIMQFKVHLTIPLIAELKKNGAQTSFSDSDQEKLDSIIAQQNSDIDKDGITDYEEQTIYGTSIYLADTDSDGISDLEEIEAGTDPNCAKGDTCQTEIVETPPIIAPNVGIGGVIPDLSNPSGPTLPTNLGNGAIGNINEGLKYMKKVSEGKLTVDELRQVLKTMGISQEEIDKLDDQQLQQIYQATLAELDKKASTQTTP